MCIGFFDYSTTVPTIMGEIVIIKKHSDSNKINLIGQETIFYP